MDELLPRIRAEIISAWRFRWWAMLAAWIISLVGFTVVSALPDTYQARATVFVDVSSRLDDVMGGVAIEWNVQEQVERVKNEILSRPVLETVARETGLDGRATTPEEMSILLASLQQQITITEVVRRGADLRRPTDTLLTLEYSDGDRETALAVVQTLLDTFVQDVVSGGQGASDTTRSFLIERIADYERMLADREQALAEFKRENVGLLPGEGAAGAGDYFSRLQAAMEQLQQLEADLRTAANRQDALRAQLASQNPSLPPGGTLPGAQPPTTGPVARTTELENTLADLLLRFTDSHPDVIATRQQLERLQQQRRDELAALVAAGGSEFEGSPLSTNPVYQNIQIALNQSKVDIAALESKIAEQRRRVEELRARVDVIPVVEARLVGLVRDYDQVKSVHDELIKRLEQERLGTAAVAVTRDLNFRVIQPPVADYNPITPDRRVLLMGVLAAAIAGSVGVAYMLTTLRPVFSRARELQEFSELPVLGTISVVHTPARKLIMRMQLAGFAVLALLLVGTFAALVKLRGEAADLARSLLA